MAKILPKGKKVTGTKKKDKIVHTGKAVWKTALTVNAGAGNDLINFKKSKYKNKIYGEAGNDTIYGGKKNDKIYGGKGNDKIYTGKGTNTVYLNKGDGKDTLYHQGSKTTIQINKANAADKTSWVKQGNDLIMTYTRKGVKASKSEVVTIKDYFNEDGTIKSDAIWLKNKQNKKLSEIFAQQGLSLKAVANKIAGSYLSDVINGTAANETITAGAGNDTINAGAGVDKIYAGAGNDYVDGGAGNDIIYGEVGVNTLKGGEGNDSITGGTGNDEIYGGAGNDYIDLALGGTNTVYGEAGTDRIINIKGNSVVDGGADDDTIVATSGNNTLKGGEGNDSITGGTGDDNIYGGIGNDTINAGAGNNNIYFNKNDGTDTILKGAGTDTLVFSEETDLSNLTFEYNGNDLNITAGGTTAILEDFTSGHSAKYIKAGNQTIEIPTNYISGNDTTVNGTAGDDLIIGTKAEGAQYIYAGSGNDVIFASSNGTTDNYIYAEEGNNIIYSSSNVSTYDYITGGTGNDTIYNADGIYNNIDLKAGGDNVVHLGTRGYYGSRIYLGAGNDTIYLSPDSTNSSNAVSITITSSDVQNGGHDTIYWGGAAYTNKQHEMISFNGIDSNNIIFTRAEGSDDLVLIYGTGNDVTFVDYFKEGNEDFGRSICYDASGIGWTYFNSDYSGNLVENNLKTLVSGVVGTTGNDYIIGTVNAETIVADEGNDIINPGGGNDTIYLYLGHNVVLAGEGNKLIEGSASAGSIINLGSGNNRVILGSGADKVNSGSGSNTIELYSSSDQGNDIYKYGGGNDTIHFQHDDLSNLSVDLRGSDIVITRGMNGALENRKTFTITNLYDLESGVTIKDKDNDTSTLLNLNLITGNSTLTSGQTITTGAGYDEIYTGLGNDIINAGTGNNTIYLTLADDENINTYNYTNGANDTFCLPEEMTDFSQVAFQKSGNDLIVGYNNNISKNTVVIKNYYVGTNSATMGSSLSFKAKNGDNYTTQTLAQLISSKGITEPITGTSGNDNSLGSSSATTNQHISGLAGNDTLYGGSCNDYLNGNAGNDVLNGGTGNDTYEIDAADWGYDFDKINDGGGTDILKINTSQDNIHLLFDVTLDKEGGQVLMDGNNARYTTGTALYIYSDSNYNLGNVLAGQPYKGVEIVNYFAYQDTGKIENIKVKSGNDWIDAFNPNLIGIMGQTIANWLNETGHSSTQDNNFTAEEKVQLKSLYNPISGGDYKLDGTENSDIIIGTKAEGIQYIYAGSGNDVIFASSNGTTDNYIYAEEGNNVIYSSSNTATDDNIIGGTGNDTIYGADGVLLDIDLKAGGDNVVHLGTRNYWGNDIYLGGGNDTIYLSPDSTGSSNAVSIIITSSDVQNGGHDTIYWGGAAYNNKQHEMICFNNTKNEDIFFTRAAGSDDLVVRYGNDNDVTFVDYFKEGNEDFGRSICYDASGINWTYFNSDYYPGNLVEAYLKTFLTANSGTVTGTAESDYLKADSAGETVTLQGGDGNDIYSAGAGVTIINDSSGNDTLYLKANKADATILLMVDNQGNFVDIEGDPYVDQIMVHNAGSDNVYIRGYNTIEKIKTADGYYTTSALLEELKTDVVNWLLEKGFTSTVDINMTTNDLNTLFTTYFSGNKYWQSSAS